MLVQLTLDDKGVSIWPIDTKLDKQPDDGEWYDTDCETRGTNGLTDFESTERMLGRELKPGERVVLEIKEKPS